MISCARRSFIVCVQQPADRVLDRLAFWRLPQPFAELAAGYGDGYAVALLAELGQLLGRALCRRLAGLGYRGVQRGAETP